MRTCVMSPGATASASGFLSPSQSPTNSADPPAQTEDAGSAAQPAQPFAGLKPFAPSKTWTLALPSPSP